MTSGVGTSLEGEKEISAPLHWIFFRFTIPRGLDCAGWGRMWSGPEKPPTD